MKRMFSGLQRRVTSPLSSQDSSSPSSAGNDSPEATIAREIKAFCESGSGPNHASNDYLHLPTIVEAAESSASAAREAAARIRKYLSSPAKGQGGTQYNAIMLIRILSENPGHTFTRNFDAKFVTTVKDLLREGRDLSALQMLRETLDMFETQKSWDEDLAPLIAMWKKEKERPSKYMRPPPPPGAPNSQFAQSAYQAPALHRQRQLPPPDELASRISEAKTSASLLIQLAQSTPAAEVQSHDLMHEFSQRCQAAFNSIQNYMAMENPRPDENTMLTLIETNEHLSVALSKYQRAILNARKAVGASTPANSHDNTNTNTNSPSAVPVVNVNFNGNGNQRHDDMSPLIPDLSNETMSPVSTGGVPFASITTATTTTYLPPSGPPPTHTSSSSSSPPVNEPQTRFDYPALIPTNVSPSSPPATTTTTTAAAATPSRRYEYNADEFNVENPFADTAEEDNNNHQPSRRAV